jgi:type II secretory pathway pseudopilin PulG
MQPEAKSISRLTWAPARRRRGSLLALVMLLLPAAIVLFSLLLNRAEIALRESQREATRAQAQALGQAALAAARVNGLHPADGQLNHDTWRLAPVAGASHWIASGQSTSRDGAWQQQYQLAPTSAGHFAITSQTLRLLRSTL